jgi:hypothetical protein
MTLNQVITRVRTLAESHKQLNGFDFGDVVDFLSKGDVKYPACYAEMSNSVLNRAERQTTYNFRIWLCDLVNVSDEAKGNELEVQSDLTSIAEDLIAMLTYPGFSDWDISFVSPIQYYNEKFEDMVSAAAMDVSISVRFNSNRCQVPTSLTFE